MGFKCMYALQRPNVRRRYGWVFFAIKDAVCEARAAVGLGVDFEIDSPATPERVRMACAGPITKQFYDSDECYRANLTC